MTGQITFASMLTMATLTISKELTEGTDLVIIPKRDYEKLLSARVIPEYQPTAREKKALAQVRKNRRAGKFLTINELKQKLGFTD